MSLLANQIHTILLPCDISPGTLSGFDQVVREAIAGNPTLLRMDCRSLERVVSSHINMLWSAHTLCHDHGIPLRLSNPPQALLRILQLLDLEDAFEYEGAAPWLGRQVEHDQPRLEASKSFADDIPAVIDDIDAALARFMAFLADIHASATTILELRTMFYEIATNIRIHSGLTGQDRFQVRAVADGDALTITFVDAGEYFDPTAKLHRLDAAAASHSRQKRGFGLPMIHQLADSVAYERDGESRNVLTVTKKWRC